MAVADDVPLDRVRRARPSRQRALRRPRELRRTRASPTSSCERRADGRLPDHGPARPLPAHDRLHGPDALCLESKSLKLYLNGFRNEGVFCEALAVRIRDDVAAALGLEADRVSDRARAEGARRDHDHGPCLSGQPPAGGGRADPFDDVSLELLRSRRSAKWTRYAAGRAPGLGGRDGLRARAADPRGAPERDRRVTTPGTAMPGRLGRGVRGVRRRALRLAGRPGPASGSSPTSCRRSASSCAR